MADDNSIKLFQFIRKYYRAIGIYKSEPSQIDRHFFNSTNWIFILSATPMLISSIAFLSYQAKTTYDFGLSIFYLSCITFSGIYYVVYIWQIENTLTFFENCETIIKQSKFGREPF